MNNTNNSSSAGCAADGGKGGFSTCWPTCARVERDLGEVDGMDFSEVGLLLVVPVWSTRTSFWRGWGLRDCGLGVWVFYGDMVLCSVWL